MDFDASSMVSKKSTTDYVEAAAIQRILERQQQ